eukprot:9623246-Alexandrium_andersonii.AAC.1
MLVSAPIRLNPHSALWNMQNRFSRSELELRGPMNDLSISPTKLSSCAFCAACRADSESADDNGDRG